MVYLLIVLQKAQKKSAAAETVCGLFVFKVTLLTCSTFPVPREIADGKDQWQVFWLAIHPPGVFPVFRPVT